MENKLACNKCNQKGYLILKCQDIVHNHKLHPTHIFATQWANEAGLKLKDLPISTNL
jgi:hypothetical protein